MIFTAKELKPLTERRRALLEIEKIRVAVYVLDARECWGKVQCLVCPVAGESQQWVSVDRLREETVHREPFAVEAKLALA
jgi:hypothetical protein